MEGRRSQAQPKRKASYAQSPSIPTPTIQPAIEVKRQKKSSSKAKGSSTAGAAVEQRKKHRSLDEVKLDGEVFRVGDQVYVVIDESLLGSGLDDEQDESHSCGICGSSDQRKSKLLECGKCLGGFHLRCLNPPLKEVPEGEWVCPHCSLGKPPRHRAIKCARDRFLRQSGLGLARIVALWHNHATGETNFTAQWYYLPEETHIGRKNHHIARELFLSRQYDAANVESILRHASVISMAEYNRCGEIGDDVFVCDYEYDSVWRRFRRYAPWDALGDIDDDWDDPTNAGLSDDEDADATFTMRDAIVGEYDHLAPGRAGFRRKKQGGQDFKVQLGARAIPDHARAPQPATALSRARRALTLAATPQSLPCREKEHETIENFVEEALGNGDGGKGRCLYISGIPGTGKTATVLQVMRSLHARAQEGEMPHFQFVEINGLRLPSPNHAYTALYEALTGEVKGPNSAAGALDTYFGQPRRGEQHTIVLLDELDTLVNKTQTVLYNMFDWPSRPGSKLSIIGIANTMDLPERLHPRIGSRLAGCRLTFHCYQREQLETIMRSRLGESVFDNSAIQLIARKVANCSGDARRCLELCRRAAEIATERHEKSEGEADIRVTIKDADASIREAFNTPHTNMVRASSKLDRLLLAAILLEVRFTGKCEVVLGHVASRLTPMLDNKPPPFAAVLRCAVSLCSSKLILCDGAHRRLKAKVALNIPSDDLLSVLKSDKQLKCLDRFLNAPCM